MTDDRWRDDYDSWKFRSPYGDRDDEPENDCDHAEYDVDWEGRATCDRCGEHWWLTGEQLQAHHEAEARWMAECDRMQRRERSPFWHAIGWLTAFTRRTRDNLWKRPPITDDVPF